MKPPGNVWPRNNILCISLLVEIKINPLKCSQYSDVHFPNTSARFLIRTNPHFVLKGNGAVSCQP